MGGARMHKNEKLLRKGYEAFAKADMEGIQKLFHPDVVWHVDGRGPISGSYKGRDEVLGFMGELISRSDGTFKVEIHDVLANDEHAVALTTATAERNGKRYHGQGVATYHVKGGKVTEAWFANNDQYSADEFWS